ncbi:hypothetical protein JCM16418_4922 [Paenibacillus pini JCM 16418]|uniref:Uncharacterized protein n=2 Tax=Paenibacillus TaxID=44249 RepID=W7YU23_9BACL|nr:hypothetical protein JCM16418_4922 [Paenibacillus pini JCM 16418]
MRLNLNLIPLLYEGEYVSFENLQSYIGKSVLGNTGEGIVVKNVDYIDRFGNQIFVKLVSDEYGEIQKQKAPKYPNFQSVESQFVTECLTNARVEKLIYKLVDEDILEDSFGIEELGIILKNLSTRAYEDIMKEG